MAVIVKVKREEFQKRAFRVRSSLKLKNDFEKMKKIPEFRVGSALLYKQQFKFKKQKIDDSDSDYNKKKKKKKVVFRVGAALKYKRGFEKMRMSLPGGIEHSHGLYWFRREPLGKGSYGSVFLANGPKAKEEDSIRNLPLEFFAVKSAEMSVSASIKKEKQILDDLKGSEHVIKCLGEEVTKSMNRQHAFYNIFLEYCAGNSLYHRIMDRVEEMGAGGLSESEAKHYTKHIVSGLQDIHARGYVHCDIKTQNILLAPDVWLYQAKIADFGLSKKAGEEKHMIRGTRLYMSPEVLLHNVQEAPADIWALGCILTEMLTGNRIWTPYDADEELFQYIAYSGKIPEIPSDVSDDAEDFIKKCFLPVESRWTAHMLSKHPFISSQHYH